MDEFGRKNTASKIIQNQTHYKWIRMGILPSTDELSVREREHTNIGIESSENSKKRKIHNNADTGNGDPSTSMKSSNPGSSKSKKDIWLCENSQRYTVNWEPYRVRCVQSQFSAQCSEEETVNNIPCVHCHAIHPESAYRNQRKLLREEEHKIPNETQGNLCSILQDKQISQTSRGVQITRELQTSVSTKSHKSRNQKQTLTTPRRTSKPSARSKSTRTSTANIVVEKIDRLTNLAEQQIQHLSILVNMILKLTAMVDKYLCPK
ncbi:PREDICTED: uncharacterized protein LOC108550883 [Eufriesea mexicana]|uniref:uncharacterized protein LOC108550883 n=1 Tax=Eufriesea mexicana TaxID=516756 RepID=UPI00083C8B44|nr:PREDICTED: uncharacterized protein LOC108550883 [Eufriesea mexicana]